MEDLQGPNIAFQRRASCVPVNLFIRATRNPSLKPFPTRCSLHLHRQPFSTHSQSFSFLKMFFTASALLLLGTALASPVDLEERASCPGVHVFGARETTVSAGYGSSATVVNEILSAYSGSTAEAINYPACGGQSSCGGVSYASSVQQGVSAVTTAVNTYNSNCPSTQLVLVGYSQVSHLPLALAPRAQ